MLKPFHFILDFIANNPGVSYTTIINALYTHRGVPAKVYRNRYNFLTGNFVTSSTLQSSGWYTWYFSSSPRNKMGADYGYYEKRNGGYYITSLGMAKLDAYNRKLNTRRG